MDNLQKITDELLNLIRMKNAAYGAAFEDDLNDYGLQAASIQMGHKMKRIKNLTTTLASDYGESVKDSIADIAGYALLTLDWMDRNPNKLRRE